MVNGQYKEKIGLKELQSNSKNSWEFFHEKRPNILICTTGLGQGSFFFYSYMVSIDFGRVSRKLTQVRASPTFTTFITSGTSNYFTVKD